MIQSNKQLYSSATPSHSSDAVCSHGCHLLLPQQHLRLNWSLPTKLYQRYIRLSIRIPWWHHVLHNRDFECYRQLSDVRKTARAGRRNGLTRYRVNKVCSRNLSCLNIRVQHPPLTAALKHCCLQDGSKLSLVNIATLEELKRSRLS